MFYIFQHTYISYLLFSMRHHTAHLTIFIKCTCVKTRCTYIDQFNLSRMEKKTETSMHTQGIISSPYLRSPYIKHIFRATNTAFGYILCMHIHTFKFNSIQLLGSSIGSQLSTPGLKQRSTHVCRQENVQCVAPADTRKFIVARDLYHSNKCNMYVRANNEPCYSIIH